MSKIAKHKGTAKQHLSVTIPSKKADLNNRINKEKQEREKRLVKKLRSIILDRSVAF